MFDLIREVTKCKYCGNQLEPKKYGFKCNVCNYFTLFDDVEKRLDSIFTDDVEERESLLYSFAKEEGYKEGLSYARELFEDWVMILETKINELFEELEDKDEEDKEYWNGVIKNVIKRWYEIFLERLNEFIKEARQDSKEYKEEYMEVIKNAGRK